MKAGAYFKDHSGVLITWILTLAVAIVFFAAFRSPVEEIIIIITVLILGGTVSFFVDFNRKKNFYDTLKANSAGLDKKYLVSETIKEPGFIEGKIAYDALCEAGRTMCEEVGKCRSDYAEFKNYIELWVHEIKLPVASLLLAAHSEKENGERYIPLLKRVDEYIENVLYYARSENSEKDYLITDVLVKRAFTDAALKAREELQLRNVAIETDNLDVKVKTDAKWLEFMFGQFIGNALKYTRPGVEPIIRVEAKETENDVRVSFADNGIGIPAADLQRVFDKSFTGKNGRKQAKSTGMGLYIVKTLCDRLGHKVEIESKEGEYTKITLVFGKDEFMSVQELNVT
ncbi:MAG: sensor histidine kinase [Lachnospiraceae bacterium]|nr:sensor histidine kinase [Lachnospiraceae bacterium]